MLWALKSKGEKKKNKQNSDGDCGKEDLGYESWCWDCISKTLEMQWNSGLGLWHVIPCLSVHYPLSYMDIGARQCSHWAVTLCRWVNSLGTLGTHSSLFLSLCVSVSASRVPLGLRIAESLLTLWNTISQHFQGIYSCWTVIVHLSCVCLCCVFYGFQQYLILILPM